MNRDEQFEKLSNEHGPLFESIISLNKYKTIVELGVARATTTNYLCNGAKKTGGFVYGFDVWTQHGQRKQFPTMGTESECLQYLNKKGHDNVKLINMDTFSDEFDEFLDRLPKIDLAFIDGDHSYKGVHNDFTKIYSRLSPNGTILFHDTLRIDGCREFMIDLRTKYYDGTFDLIEFPWGNLDRRVGINVLVKRTFPILGLNIDEECGSISSSTDILKKEKDWYNKELKENEKNNILRH